MIIDCHYHYFPSEFDVEKKLLDMDAAGIDKIALIAPICPIFKSEPMSLPMRFMRLLMGKAAFYPLLKKLLCTFRGDGIDILGEHVPIFFVPGNNAIYHGAGYRSRTFSGSNPPTANFFRLLCSVNLK